MDCGPRRLTVTTFLYFVSATVWLTATSTAEPPTRKPVKSAVVTADAAVPADAKGTIRQVVGKQPSSGNRRRLNLLGLFGGESNASAAQSTPSARSSVPPRSNRRQRGGLLDALFGGSGEDAKTAAQAQNPGSVPMPEPADWDGIPYHDVGQERPSRNRAAQPIRDPSHQRSASRRSTTGRTPRPADSPVAIGSSLLHGQPTKRPEPEADEPSDPQPRVVRGTTSRRTLPVPSVAEPKVAKRPTKRLSERTSSRRSATSVNRDMRSVVESIQEKRQKIRGDSTIDDLVPRVSKRVVASAERPKGATESSPEPASSRRQKQVTAPEPTQVAGSESVNEDKTATPTAAAKSRRTPSATIPSRQRDSVESATPPAKVAAVPPAAAIPPVPTLQAPKAVSPSVTPAPMPYAASQPVPAALQDGTVAGFQATSQPRGDHAASNGLANDTSASNVTPSGPPADRFGPVDPYHRNDPPLAQPKRPTVAPERAVAGPMVDGPMVAGQSVAGQPQFAMELPAVPASTKPRHDMAATSPEDTAVPMLPATTGRSVNASNVMRERSPESDFATRKLAPGETAVASELPSIRVVTHGPGEMIVRQTREYEIRVENRGSIDAEGLLVRALIPDWADIMGQTASRGSVQKDGKGEREAMTWTIDRLPAGKSEKMMVRLKAMRSGLFDLDVDWTLVPQRAVAKVRVQQPKLKLSIDGPEEVVFGESQTYQVRVVNPGDGVAPNVVFTLSPNSSAPQAQRIGSIPAGKEAQFEVELTAHDLGSLRIHGLAKGDLELEAEAHKVIRVAAAKLEAVLSGPELKYQNAEAEYQLELHNEGSATSKNIVALLQLPGGVEYLGGLEGAKVNGNEIRWTIDSLAPKSLRDYRFRCRMAATGNQPFEFSCEGTAAGQARVDLATTVEAIADLVLSVNDPPAPAPIGQDVTYEIIVKNRGSKEARQVRAIAQFSHGIEPHRVSGQSGEVLTGQVLFDPIARIAPGQEVRLQVVARAENSGHHRFRTEVRSGDIVLLAEEATHYLNPRSERVSRRSTDNRDR